MRNEDNSCNCDFRYRSHVIYDGKYGMRGLPAVYAGEKEAQTLEITMEDTVSGLRVILTGVSQISIPGDAGIREAFPTTMCSDCMICWRGCLGDI